MNNLDEQINDELLVDLINEAEIAFQAVQMYFHVRNIKEVAGYSANEELESIKKQAIKKGC